MDPCFYQLEKAQRFWPKKRFCCCCCSVTHLRMILCDPMDWGTPVFPVLHHLPELAQTCVHWVSDAIQPSCLLSSPSPPAFNLSQQQGLFRWCCSSAQVAKVLELHSASVLPMNIQGWFPIGLTGLISLQSTGALKSLLQHHNLKASILNGHQSLIS